MIFFFWVIDLFFKIGMKPFFYQVQTCLRALNARFFLNLPRDCAFVKFIPLEANNIAMKCDKYIFHAVQMLF